MPVSPAEASGITLVGYNGEPHLHHAHHSKRWSLLVPKAAWVQGQAWHGADFMSSDPVDQGPGTRHKRVPNAVRGETSLPPDPKSS